MVARYYASGQVEAPFGTYDPTNAGIGLGPQENARAMYSPEQSAYLDQQAAYTAAQQAQGYNVSPLRQFVTSAPMRDRREDVEGGTVAATDNFQRPRGQQRYLTPEEVDAQMAAASEFSPDIASRFGTNISAGPNAQTRVSYADQPFQLYNKGKLVFEGKGRDDALKATQMAQGFTDVGGNKADWELKTKLGPEADYTTVAKDAADISGVMGAFVNYGLPLLMAASLGPAGFLKLAGEVGATTGLQMGAAKALTAAALGAAGGGLSKGLQGASIGDIAKTAGISGLTAGVMQGTGLTDALQGALGGSVAGGPKLSNAFNAARGAAGSLIPEGIATVGLGGLGNAAGSLANEILVTAAKQVPSSLASSSLGSLAGSALSNVVPAQTAVSPQETPEAVVTASRFPPPISAEIAGIPAAAIAAATPAIAGIGSSPVTTEPLPQEVSETVVTASRFPTSPFQGALPIPIAPPMGPVDIPTIKKPLTLQDYIRYGMGASSLLQGIGGLLGSGNDGNVGAGIGGFNPNMGTVSYQPLNRVRNAPTFDPFTYGQAGGNQPAEFRFFQPSAPNFQINQPAQVGIVPNSQSPILGV